MPRIGIDCRFASEYAGLGTYTRELVTALLKRSDGISYTLFVRSATEGWIKDLPEGTYTLVKAPFRHYSFSEQWRLPRRIRRAKIDLWFSPQFNVPARCPVPFVCTVHDLILHKYPNHAGGMKQKAYHYLFDKAVFGAKKIITISESTKKDLIKIGNADSAKIVVIPPGVSPSMSPRPENERREVCEKYGLENRFLLYVGNAKEHKNVPLLLKAFGALKRPTIDLVLVTGGKEGKSLKLPPRVHRLEDVPAGELPALYSSAEACVTATLYEGFGLPLAEAMACNCPVIATNVASIPEVCGTHAILVKPNKKALTDAMEGLLSGEKKVDTAKAREWVKKFSWDATAERVAGVFVGK